MHHKTEVKLVRVVSLKSLCWIRDVSSLLCRSLRGLRATQSRHGYSSRAKSSGFTAIEILIVVVVISIVAMMAIPMMTSASGFQIRSAANMIAADLEYAKSMAISRGRNFSVVFDKTTETYQIEDQGGTVISHPVKKGFDYVVDFSSDSSLSKVDIADVDFDPGSGGTITFDYMGSPYSGAGISNPLNSGVVTLQVSGASTTINIEPVTGFITVTD